jgi:hypothetical protein
MERNPETGEYIVVEQRLEAENAAYDAAEAAFTASLPACTDPSGHVEGFCGFCSHCGVDVLFEDSAEFDALLDSGVIAA